ncbi:MAG: CPBP family intramembrane metalloprotease [Planctomycetia bacterium]|uniref:CAAX prenyl protease 2/Lysostaphin resistance protein A-like domain-containing protein n=1 Tax=Candidatus Brocadia sapporoensis TaxID=392547 RepID=A0A1V6LXM1_9BACT|nr:CPBP family intramembrane glutamic endopeptidase [Candidatus Brocadia sapporoensis]MCC7238949.1 CPBP family intramembrane metalloprotease [Candidatus Brocadia sp.]QOJ06292.1 MAG: CPBP family intramembrane metalloprotease [Planctomycetia bacterium]TVL94982.1 MAG: CPBP family intramembrane metalloprotease [Candidatus Brocadia sp. BL1]MDG6006214.1 CPBP family intramembrane metalloprotease [Candidatus Brocadia sp.]OQD44891.1 hypothetical protein BIY37_11250 [Candidatus Brocadia sapporoensis]
MESYYHRSKNIANSYLFILPLLVLYETGIALQGSGIKNASGVFIEKIFTLFGKNGSLIFNFLVIVFFLISAIYVEKKHKLDLLTFIFMFLESVVYALFIGNVIGYVVYKLLFPCALARPFSVNMWLGIILSIGAGVYEEIVFRLLLIKLLCFVFATLLKISKPMSATISVMTGALLFAAMHYVGSLGDVLTDTNFTFRALSGVVLATIFLSRGLGVAVYTHAIYDVLSVLKPFHVSGG